MSTIKLATPAKPQGKITFSSFNLPALDDGLYKIEVDHDFQAEAGSTKPTIPTQTRYFAAIGPRYSLDPKEISTQFPPPKTSGNYYNILPHIMFNRAILPWERKLDPSKPNTPWLTLISCTNDEMIGWQKSTANKKLLTVCTNTLTEVCQDAQTNKIVFPKLSDITLLPGESSSEPVNYIDIPEPLLQLVLPTEDELPTLANVRQSADPAPSGSENPKYPVLICNRLPQPGQENTVFLISLENRMDVYTQLASATPLAGVPSPSSNPKIYRFAVLNNWRFASVTPNLSFEELLLDANKFKSTTTGSFRLPSIGDVNADPFLEKGYVPLEHQTRQGNNMVSWYRGPFLPGVAPVPTNPPAPSSITSPDSLVRVYSEIGMFDVTYASAWNIGRSLILENKRVSQALFEWKRACVQAEKATLPSHLPFNKAIAPPLPDLVKNWFINLGRLEQIPFNYLVADQKLLPQESIQFFSVDAQWVQLLLRGAFSIGDIASSDEAIEDELFKKIPIPTGLSGFLLRSKVVSGWPHLLVNGFDTEPPTGTNLPFESGATPLTQYRYTLGKDTLLCLFEGSIKSVEVYLHPETIHFGIDYYPEDAAHGIPSPCYLKLLRDASGNPIQPTTLPCGTDRSKEFDVNNWVRIPFRFDNCGVIDSSTLVKRLTSAIPGTTITPAEFAYQMVEGVPKVRFTAG
ncbi:MAG: hypothetical protein ACMZ7B_11750 [Balneola sp.]